MKAEELLRQPNNIIFYERTVNEPIIYQKIETFEGDVVVLGFDLDFEKSRLGLPEMNVTDREKRDFHVYSKDELKVIIDFFTLAYLQNTTAHYRRNPFDNENSSLHGKSEQST